MEINDVQSFLKYYSRIKYRTRRLFDYIPEDKIEWTYREGKFTIGDIIRHLANIERFMYAENAQFKPSLYDGCDEKYAKDLDEVIKYYDVLHEESMTVFSKLTQDDLNKKCMTPGNVEITLWKWLRAMVEHEIHHRGQLYFYLGMMGIETPPMYGLTSEEVAARSGNSKNIKLKELEVPFKVLFFLKGKEQSIIEIKRTDIESDDKSKIYFWLRFYEKDNSIERLIFSSMKTTGEVEERKFTEGVLIFDNQSGHFSNDIGEQINFKNEISKKIPKEIELAVLDFFN